MHGDLYRRVAREEHQARIGRDRMSAEKKTWAVADHLCIACGGRILRCVRGAGPTPGGNPVWRCASCGNSTSGMSPDGLCWCGHSHRGQHSSGPTRGFICLPFSAIERIPSLRDAFLACGCDPDRDAEVGIVTAADYHEAARVGAA